MRQCVSNVKFELQMAQGTLRRVSMPDLEPIRRALETSPDNVPLLLLYGQGCLEEWALDEAENTFQKVLSNDGRNVDARLGLAHVLALSGRGSEAVVRLEAMVSEQPRNARAQMLLARVHLTEGDVREARAAYRKAREIDPTASDAGLEKELGVERRRVAEGAMPQINSPMGEDVDDPADPFAGFDDDFANFEDDDAFDSDDIERPCVKFDDVAGHDAVKKELSMVFVHPLAHPDLFRSYGKFAGGGVLLYGPPGCGKTLLAQATAGEAGSKLLVVRPHQVLDMYIGNSEKNLHQVFQMARENAPIVLFFDEVEALATDRRETRATVPRSLIHQFLTELDSCSQTAERVLVVAATNAPWLVDSAFRRAGRFDRSLYVPPPDDTGRALLLRMLAREKPVGTIDFERIAALTEGFTGADLVRLFERVVEDALFKAMEGSTLVPLDTEGFLQALPHIHPSAPAWQERFQQS